MTRERDTTIPANEKLFRGLKAAWVDGDAVLPDGVDLDGTSCDREKYGGPNANGALKLEKIGFTTLESVGSRYQGPSGQNIEIFGFDDPIDGPTDTQNEAHMEIRFRRAGRTSTDNDKPNNRAVKEGLRLLLAASIRLR